MGLSNGQVYYWKKKNMEQKYLVDKGKDPELLELDAPSSHHHKGDIKCLVYAKIEGLDVLVSGSADRTIKLWEPKNAIKASLNGSNKGGSTSVSSSQGGGSGGAASQSACFQTIIGHGGSIIAMAIVQKV